MIKTKSSWAGQPISGTLSTGSQVFAALDWQDMVIQVGDPIRRKACDPSGQIRAFDIADQKALKARYGRYSNLQSINSEDTVTWSIFGCASPEPWLGTLFETVFGVAERPTNWTLDFWQRTPHPDTGSSNHGPEHDIIFQSPDWRYAGEAKWTRDIDGAQGRSRTISQLEMRAHWASSGIPSDQWGVIVIAPQSKLYKPARSAESVFRRYFTPSKDKYIPTLQADAISARAITWEQILEIVTGRTGFEEVAAYLKWRLEELEGQS